MCSHFGQGMDNYQGDLTDILRASVGAAADTQDHIIDGWEFSSDSYNQPMNFSSSMEFSIQENFGDPFSNMQDPLLSELDIAGPSFFNSSSTSSEIVSTSVVDLDPGLSVGNMVADQSTIIQDEMKIFPSCNNMFSQMIISQNPTLSDSSSVISTAASSPRGINNPVVVSRDMVNANSSKGCLVDNTGLQISSPRNPGIKRRKSDAKKVVCIPAPASSNGRPGGEVVPSDLWAWRKYGQKPIKGSPYPRGYYRCSSSKGCSARKQVERSRTDPNMLVITYTSEHNHPWPTQRNSLAGSTRSQVSKNNASTSKTSTSSQTPKRAATTMKEEEDEEKGDSKKNIDSLVLSPCAAGSSCAKEETSTDQDIENMQMDMDDAHEFGEDFSHSSYVPTMTDSSYNSEDFFVDLGELEGDPLSGLFSQGFTGDKHKVNKGNVDPFSALFD